MLLDELVGVIETLKERIRSHRNVLSANEYRTRVSLIDPLLCVLGWDTADPELVLLEYEPDSVIESDDQVDYALLKGGLPLVLVEAKRGSRLLNNQKYFEQLFGYFGKTPSAKVAILTNGIQYKCYSDRQNQNVMDSESFWDFDITNLTPKGKEILLCFSKDQYNLEKAIKLIANEKEKLVSSHTENRDSDPVRQQGTDVDSGWTTLKDLVAGGRKDYPKVIRFPNKEECGIKNWKDMLIKIATYLVEEGHLTPDILPISESPRSRVFIVNNRPEHKTGATFGRSSRELGEGVFLFARGGIQLAIDFSQRVVTHCKQDTSKFLLKTG